MKIYRRILSLMLVILLITAACSVSTVSVTAANPQPQTSGDFTYVRWSDGSVTIIGCSSKKAELVIPAEIDGYPVSSIRGEIMDNKKALKSVIISEGIKTISGAFEGCKKLETVVLPDSLTTIGLSAFEECELLNNINIPDGVTLIDTNAFSGCLKLTNIDIPDSVTEIGEYAFSGTEISVLDLPDNLVSIGEHAFSAINIKEITIPESVEFIGESAFSHCQYLETISLPEYTYINMSGDPFELTLWYEAQPEGIIYLDRYAIGYKGHIPYGADIVFKDGTECIVSEIFDSAWDSDFVSSIKLPESLKFIGASAFKECTAIESIVIPDSVERIDEYAFEGCKSLKSVNIPDGVTKLDYVFRYSGIESISIPASVTSMKEAFSDCNNLSEVAFADGIEEISDYAFSGCEMLQALELPSSVKTIGGYAFRNCEALSEVTFEGQAEYIGSDVFENTAWLSSKPEGFVYLGDTLIAYNGIDNILSELVLPDNTRAIAGSVFEGAKALKRITIPNGVLVINDHAFLRSGLEEIVIPDTVCYIGRGICANTPVEFVVINGSGTIGHQAFYSCANLMSVTISANIDEIGDYAFGVVTNPENGNSEYIKGFTIYGYANSYAEVYAINCGFKFVEIISELIGDVNQDQRVSVRDATLIQKYLAGLIYVDSKILAFADVNGDNKVNIKDATAIQKYVAGIIDSFS